MKKIFAALFLLTPAFAFAGPPVMYHDWISHHSTINLSASQFNTDFTLLNKQFSLWGAKENFNANYYMAGINLVNGQPSERFEGKWDGSFSLERMISEEVTIGHNDSLSYKMRGWHMLTSSYGKDLIPGDMVALVIAPGIDWGNMKLFRTTGGEKTKYKNPFVAPLVRADLRFVFGKFSLGGRASYRYDITYDRWKRKDDLMPVLPGTHFHGLSLQAFIGMSIDAP